MTVSPAKAIYAAFERAVAVARANEVCPRGRGALVESTVDALDRCWEWLEGLAIARSPSSRLLLG